MKHKKIILPILILCILLINPKVNAATVRTSSSTVYPGQSFTASVTLTAAAWNVHSTASGPVSGCVMNDANASDSATNISKTVSTTCYATGVGTITISLSGDYTTEDGANYPLSGTGYVSVVNAPANKPSGGGGNWGGGGNYTPTPETPKSTNNFLKSLSVKDCTISPTFDKNVLRYACSDLTIDKTEIIAEVEDSKAKVTGTGNVNLRNGDNNFEVVVTAEDGSTKTYKVLLNKKNIPSTKILSLKIDNNGYTIDDEFLLLGLNKDTKELNIEVDLDSSTAKSTISGNKNLKPGINVITIKVSDTDCKTKEYKVIVYIPEEEEIDLSKITELDKNYIVSVDKSSIYSIKKEVLEKVNNNKLIYNIVDNNKGLIASLDLTKPKHLEKDYEFYLISNNNKIYTNIFEDTKITIFTGSKFKKGKKIYIYEYNEEQEKYILIKNQKYNNYYATFNTTKASEYLISEKKLGEEEHKSYIIEEAILIVCFQIFLISVIVSIVTIKMRKKYSDGAVKIAINDSPANVGIIPNEEQENNQEQIQNNVQAQEEEYSFTGNEMQNGTSQQNDVEMLTDQGNNNG